MDETAGLRRTLLWLIGLRAVTVSVLLGAAVAVHVRTPAPRLPVDPVFGLVALTYALTAFYAATLRFVRRYWLLVDVQLGVDVALVAAIVALTGGIESYFSSLFVLPVVSASVVLRRRGGLAVGILSAAAYAAVLGLQYGGALGEAWRLGPGLADLPPAREAWLSVALSGAGFISVGALTGYLAESLRQADQELERASSEIADLQAFSQTIVDSMTGGVATTDRHGRITTFNRAAESITGVPAPEAKGHPVWQVLQLPPAYRGDLAGLVSSGQTRRVEAAFTAASGRRLDLGLTAVPLAGVGDRAGFLFTFQDLTDEKRRRNDQETQKRLAAIGEVAAGIAHEIRNPLASMAGSIQVLRQELSLSDEQADLLDIVLRESRRLDQTIGNFLAYARPRRGSAGRVEVRRLLNETALLLRNSPEFGAGCRVEADPGVADMWIVADEAQLRQVVWNLATNGMRAMSDGGLLRLRAEARQSGDIEGVVLSVEDNGKGMSSQELDTLFQPFRSGFTHGTGLGLAIVHRIVSEHGGQVSVSSAPGHGTLVRIWLPCRLDGQVSEASPDAATSGAGRLPATGTDAR